ncbi:hypothetical protein Ga0074812_103329 [Parafrankia irregularis]|uniref:PH domain-containing protein n=1 Tax=Parafrankia irregularis TaxID=795642 RepID=A0A0S4QH92_9ACTN|nr:MULTISPECIES: hypothetical protein [Parafrankia]MBE3200771.1 hypothetical protein [Parafrankia sp. CH37]CUU54839.1 hypothetical protein Ga0074812_103329 [Parafrankia irregularis]
MSVDGVVLRPRLYRWLATAPAFGFALVGVAGLMVPSEDAGGVGGRIVAGLIAATAIFAIVRILRLRVVIGETGVSFVRLQRSRRIGWDEIDSSIVVDAGEILPWKIPVVSLKSGRELRLDEYRTLRKDPASSIAESVVRALGDAQNKYDGKR